MQHCVGSVYFCLIIFGRGPKEIASSFSDADVAILARAIPDRNNFLKPWRYHLRSFVPPCSVSSFWRFSCQRLTPKATAALRRNPWFNEKRSLLWMMTLIFWSLSLDASSFSWMLGQIVERIFVNCLSLICTRVHPTCRSSMLRLAMHLFDLSLRVSLVYVALGSNLTQDGPKDLHRLRRLTRLWGGRSSGSGKRSAIAPQTSLFGVTMLPKPTMKDSPVPTG